MPASWAVHAFAGTVAELHARGLEDERGVRLCRPTDSAVVIGSTQTEPASSPIPVVRRRSGGGAVVVAPGEVVWIDVCLPAGDPLWEVDVGRAFWWLGETWSRAIHRLGEAGGHLAVHRTGVVGNALGRLICFGGIGPGEVLIDGQKAVGLCQRRTRAGALFQSAVLLQWDPTTLVDIVGAPADAVDLLRASVHSFPRHDVGEVEDAFVASLPD